MPHTRSRLSTEEMRRLALEAARSILIDEGPQAVTLMAVAKRISRTHANVLHHFGSAGELRRAMAEMMVGRVAAEIGAEVVRVRQIEGDLREIVDITFDAFEKQGMAALMSWMILSGEHEGLAPVLDAVHNLVEELGEYRGAPLRQITQILVLTALGEGMIGGQIAEALEVPRETARATLAHQLRIMRGW
ncbi:MULTISPECIES: TetR/AcrR family transcriptional regulator [unclassified Sphingomonas]|uniref:TetR/AcrR family transcriptional regulator n=1 Tax=unclassified Sphingomonas TaxID=196159 RepID=UPI0006F8E3A1|nr:MULTISPECIES: TetR family transcriptional regulator [unclassified Sphingomonas]KQX17785.1 TetR family transcriptional regulator [Sphingomonas sp. Root1294]KQY70711.1 TetR family transcriptional regulator [Sphingomonas sp. Root50]KRB92184.1 TetR family transcriptional regulator [Sphingomonas sp. Root720]